MDRSKIVAIITGAISLLLAVAYLLLVQLLDFRGEMVPAPLGILNSEFGILNSDVGLNLDVGLIPTSDFRLPTSLL